MSTLSIPNQLTLFRLASAPLFLFFFIGSGTMGLFKSSDTGLFICLIVAILSELSDVFDGLLARRWNQVSDFGKILDPYADSTFRLSVFFAYASNAHGRWIPLWMVMVLFYRDLLVTVIRNFGIEQRVFVHARASGKIKAIAQGTAGIAILVIAVIWGKHEVELKHSGTGTNLAYHMMFVVLLITLWSAFDYLWANRHLFQLGKRATGPLNSSSLSPSVPPPPSP